MKDMSEGRIEVFRTPRGEYRIRMVGYDGPPIRVAKNASGIKRTAAERAADKRAVQAGLKMLYEQQQAKAS